MPCHLFVELPTKTQNSFYGFNPNSNIVTLFPDENNPRASSLNATGQERELILFTMFLIQVTCFLNFKILHGRKPHVHTHSNHSPEQPSVCPKGYVSCGYHLTWVKGSQWASSGPGETIESHANNRPILLTARAEKSSLWLTILRTLYEERFWAFWGYLLFWRQLSSIYSFTQKASTESLTVLGARWDAENT